MIPKYLFLLLVGISLFLPEMLSAQQSESVIINDTAKIVNTTNPQLNTSDFAWKPSVSPFIELMGKGFFSINVDYRWNASSAVSLGIQPMEGLLPDLMYYHFFGKKQRFEIGGGLSTGFSNKLTLSGILIHGVIGYRYQKKKGIFFRAGFTPLYTIFFDSPDRNQFLPLAGLSFGYSF